MSQKYERTLHLSVHAEGATKVLSYNLHVFKIAFSKKYSNSNTLLKSYL